RAVGLLERLEDQLLLVLGNADTGIGNRDLDRAIDVAQDRVGRTPALGRQPDTKRDAALRGKFEGVGQKVEYDLLQPFLVGPDRRRQLGVELDVEVEALVG